MGLRLGDQQFDTVFTNMRADADGQCARDLADPTTGRTLTQSFDSAFTQCVVYTPPHREAICMEPYTCVPDAIRLAAEGHETGLQIFDRASTSRRRFDCMRHSRKCREAGCKLPNAIATRPHGQCGRSFECYSFFSSFSSESFGSFFRSSSSPAGHLLAFSRSR